MNIIGTITTYHGTEHRYMDGYKVRIIAVLKADGHYVKHNEELAQVGGVGSQNRIEVLSWIESKGRFSFASSDPRAINLACFASLR